MRGDQRPGFGELVEAYLETPTSRVFDWIDYAGSRRFVAERGYACWILLVLASWLEPAGTTGASR